MIYHLAVDRHRKSESSVQIEPVFDIVEASEQAEFEESRPFEPTGYEDQRLQNIDPWLIEVLELHMNGWKYSEIAEHFGMERLEVLRQVRRLRKEARKASE